MTPQSNEAQNTCDFLLHFDALQNMLLPAVILRTLAPFLSRRNDGDVCGVHYYCNGQIEDRMPLPNEREESSRMCMSVEKKRVEGCRDGGEMLTFVCRCHRRASSVRVRNDDEMYCFQRSEKRSPLRERCEQKLRCVLL